ncbi:hypothetical protein EAX62_10560 [Tessaracoccus antarcticus]|uniref:Antitermination protein NusB n=2 Tax=Tessaracoccus antarcticus TaxID=2479848 RepID=A0A3M0G6I6_9ACTN|nr:hypothetical protein EAX62_10560 [Tessaracoccus antarcticus]
MLRAMYDTSMEVTSWSAGGGGWFTLVLINAALAEQKNGSRLNWFLVPLLLGPLATLLIVAMRPPE